MSHSTRLHVSVEPSTMPMSVGSCFKACTSRKRNICHKPPTSGQASRRIHHRVLIMEKGVIRLEIVPKSDRLLKTRLHILVDLQRIGQSNHLPCEVSPHFKIEAHIPFRSTDAVEGQHHIAPKSQAF